MATDPFAWPVLLQVADCLTRAYQAAGVVPECGINVIPGQVATFDGSEMGWVRLVSVGVLTGDEEGRLASGTPCAAVLTASLEVGTFRCFPIPEEGEAPTTAQYLERAEATTRDMHLMRRALTCCDVPLTLGTYTPFGPGGGVVGGIWTADF